ncbi:sensor histidine kinase [Halorussus aquaticus]|uniref:histidine kinase n=1 Tax=Halorussus aquaticus TaxID=2953748 RepID=A0ABD5PXZ9_9EURY|nr:HAMP domain-containing sensor histidine kinase [Halorussus aquaticus]
MSSRETVLQWSVTALGCLLLVVVVADLLTASGSTAVKGVERALPALLALLLAGLGVWLRRRGVAGRDVGIVSLGVVGGAALFVLIDFWLVFIISLGGPIPKMTAYPTLNLVAIGATGNAVLTALYLRLRRQNEKLQRLTERLEERNERLDHQTAKLESQNERLNQFAGIVSHDLRNPLNVAAGRLGLARETGDEEHFEAVERAHDRMDTLVTETLSLARHGKTVEETATVSLASVAESAWGTVPTGETTLSVVTDGRFEADANRLQRTFENLFRNAVEHGGTVGTVRVGLLDAGGFYVEDDGDGIPAADREAVFEFGRSSASDGTGYGLAVVEAIVAAHGWSIDVTEGTDGGARFEVTTDGADAFGV